MPRATDLSDCELLGAPAELLLQRLLDLHQLQAPQKAEKEKKDYEISLSQLFSSSELC